MQRQAVNHSKCMLSLIGCKLIVFYCIGILQTIKNDYNKFDPCKRRSTLIFISQLKLRIIQYEHICRKKNFFKVSYTTETCMYIY